MPLKIIFVPFYFQSLERVVPTGHPKMNQQDHTGEGSAHRPPQDEPTKDQQDHTGEGSAHRPPQDDPTWALPSPV
jgi:hypothetical protein